MLHLIKLVVGVQTLDDLERIQAASPSAPVVNTRSMPRRREEILDGGSIFRVLDGMILCRQRVVDIQSAERADGSTGTIIVMDRAIIPVEPRVARPFQGWRYLEPADAPHDLDVGSAGDLPPDLARQLRLLGLL